MAVDHEGSLLEVNARSGIGDDDAKLLDEALTRDGVSRRARRVIFRKSPGRDHRRLRARYSPPSPACRANIASSTVWRALVSFEMIIRDGYGFRCS